MRFSFVSKSKHSNRTVSTFIMTVTNIKIDNIIIIITSPHSGVAEMGVKGLKPHPPRGLSPPQIDIVFLGKRLKCDQILENHHNGCILVIKYLALK